MLQGVSSCLLTDNILMKKIIGIGETVLDIVFRNDQPLKAVPGGSAFNAIISIGRTDTPCVMVTEVGDDHVGDIVTSFLAENNVVTDYVFRHEGTQSHISLAFLDDNNDAQYQFYKMHEQISIPERFPAVSEGDIVLFGSYFAINPKVRHYVAAFLMEAKEKGAILYYDINFRASHIKDLPVVMPFIEENIGYASVVRGSSEDFSILYGLDDVDAVYENHIKSRCEAFIYTDASKPVQLRTSSLSVSYDVKQIATVSTIGAGDNFNAGFCYGLYNEDVRSISELDADMWARMMASGQRFSSFVCQSLDNYISKEFAAQFSVND